MSQPPAQTKNAARVAKWRALHPKLAAIRNRGYVAIYRTRRRLQRATVEHYTA